MTEYDYATDIAVKQEEAYAIGLEQGIEQGLERGAHQKALETAKNLLSMGLSPEQVAQGTNLPLEILHQIQSNL